MSDLDELYQELILDHANHPQQYGDLIAPTHIATGINPICGDDVCVTLDIKDNIINDIKFQGHGCVLSKASASMMASLMKGKTLNEMETLLTDFYSMLTRDTNRDYAILGKLQALANVKKFPMRVKCVTLSWHTLQAAVHNHQGPVSTEEDIK